ncbi:MAG: hypothetical protein AAF170_01760 [Bacteroidota bacterium]
MLDFSVVLVTPTDFDQIRETVHHLLAQTALDRMELIVVAPSREALGGELAELDLFPSHQIVEVGPVQYRGQAAAAGVRMARALVVGLVEEHAYPEPGYVEALIRAHEGPWAGVSPVIRNANPASTMSWVNFYRAYLGLAEPHCAGEVDNVAWHNSAYKRDLLMAFGDKLGTLLDFEGDLLHALKQQGHRFYLEPEAQTRHANVEHFRALVHLSFLKGRLGAASRVQAENWSLGRRLAYVAGSPLIPLMYVPGFARGLSRTRQPAGRLAQTVPFLGLSLLVNAVGEVVGLLRGASDEKHKMEAYELNRSLFLSRRSLSDRARRIEALKTTPLPTAV